MSQDNIFPILAAIGFNEGANKGFWRVQPREEFGDGAGQWIEMGAELRMFYKDLRGQTANVTGRAVGSTGTPDGVRVLVQGQSEKGVPDGIYGAKTSAVRVAEGFIPDEVLKKQGIENTVKISKEQEATLPTIDSLERTDITDEDLRLINEGANSKEGKQHAEYKKSVEAEESNRQPSKESTSTPARGEKPKAYGRGNANDFKNLPDGTVLDEYERAQFYPSVDDYSGAFGPVSRQAVKQDGKWYRVSSKTGKPIGKPLNTSEMLNSGTYADVGASSKADENGNKVAAWADEVGSSTDIPNESGFDIPAADPNDLPQDFDGSGRLPTEPKAEDFVLLAKKDDLKGPEELYVDDEGIEYAWPDSFRVPEATRDLTEVPPADQTDAEIAFQIGGKGGSNLSDEQFDALSAEAKNRIDARITDNPVRYNEPTEPSSLDGAEKAVMDAYGKGFFGDEVPNDEQVINFAQRPPKDTELKFSEELEPGDVIRGFDNEGTPYEGTVQAKPTVAGTLRDNRKKYLIRILVGNKIYPLMQAADEGLQVIKGRKGPIISSQPGNNNLPPVPPTKPPKPVVPGRSGKKMDNGKVIPRQVFTEADLNAARKAKVDLLIDKDGAAPLVYDANGKPYNPLDGNAMMNFLAQKYTESRFNKQGQLVLMREIRDENGKKIQWEIRAFLSGEKKVGYMFVFKDLKTGEETTEIHKDMRDSMRALFGKTNGPEVLADILTGVQTRKYNKANDTANANDVIERARYFKLQGRLKSIEDTAKYYATGYAERINFSKGDGTLLEKEVPSVYDAINSGDYEGTLERLKAVFGRIPYDEESHGKARTALREQYAALFPTVDKRSFGMAVSVASEYVRDELLSRLSNRAVPYSSADKVSVVKKGSIVEYTNNIGEVSVVRVLDLQRLNYAQPKNEVFGYGDYATIIGADGKPTSAPTNALRVLKDQETPLTELKKKVTGAALKAARGVGYRSSSIIFPGQTEVTDVDAPIDQLTPGDNLYSKAGQRMGVAVEVVPVTGANDKKGYGILYVTETGEVKKVAIATGEIRGPNIAISSSEQTTPEAAPKKQIISDTEESDPDFDLDSIEFETDPDTVEVPITLKSNFKLPINAKRTAEEQLALNEEIKNELRLRNTDLSNALEGWTYNSESMSTSGYLTTPELQQEVFDAWKIIYPNLSDDEIRQLIELNSAKFSGYFNMSKQQILNELQKRGAEYSKPDGAVRKIQFSVKFNSESEKNELVVTDQEKTAYLSSINDIEKFASTAKLGEFFNPEKQIIRILDTESDFAAAYRGVSGKPRDTSNVLGVNISRGGSQSDPTKPIVILINNARIRRIANDPNDKATFKNVYGDTLAHEVGHSIHETLQSESFGKRNFSYAEAYKEFISEYGETNHMEHFAEAFAKYIQLGEAPPAFLAFLKSVGLAQN